MRRLVKAYFRAVSRAVRAHRRQVVFCVALFTICIAASYAAYTPEASVESSALLRRIAELGRRFQEADSLGRVWLIFFNNAKIAALSVALGVVALVPMAVVAINGIAIGTVMGMSTAKGLGVWEIIVFGLAPHGVFELPAVLLSTAAGLRIGLAVIGSWAGRRRPGFVGRTVREALLLTVGAVLPALLIAAVLEVTVTPALAGRFLLKTMAP